METEGVAGSAYESDGNSPTYANRKYHGQWRNWRRRSLTGVDPVFSTKSQFNKEKWLPLCHDAPFLISHYCCNVFKKNPLSRYEHANHVKPIIGTMTEESRVRKQAWLRHGCNAFDSKKQTCQPMSFWTEQDVLNYIRLYHVKIVSVYGQIFTTVDNREVWPVENKGYFTDDGDFVQGMEGCTHHCSGCQRTGCIFCGFGVHLEKGETRFQRLAKTHPKQYEYCIGGGQWIDNPHFDPTDDGKPDEMGWVNWNPKKIWVPSEKGLGMGQVFRICNDLYGKDFIRYE